MRIYVADLAAYNSGYLHGVWIDAIEDVAKMQEQVNAMLAKSPEPNVTRAKYHCADCERTYYVTQGFNVDLPETFECDECGHDLIMDGAETFEHAARRSGWSRNDHNGYFTGPVGHPTRMADYDSWEDLCSAQEITPAPGKPFPSAEEYAIHDHEGLGDLGEYAGLGEVARRASVAELADERDIPLTVLLDYARDCLAKDWDSDDLESALDDHFARQAESWAEFAEDWTRDTNDMSAVPSWLEYHIDWESIARDFEICGDFTAYRESGVLYIFYTH